MFSVGVTDCKAISPVHPIFHWSWSPKNNLSQHCSTKPIPTTTSSTACWLRTWSTEWVIACMQKAQTNCIRVQKHIKLYNNPTTLEFNQATPNAYQTIALCLSFEILGGIIWFLGEQKGGSVVTENPKGGITENFGRIQTKSQMPKIMHKILWQRKHNELQGISGCLSIGDAVLFKYVNIGACRGNRDSVTACAAKNNLHSGIHTDWNALDLNCHFYVVEVTKQMYVFSRLWLYSPKGHQWDVSSIAILADLKNELNKSKQQEERIRRLDTVWLFKWKEVKWP